MDNAPVAAYKLAQAVIPEIPAYLRDTCYRAYLNPRNVRLLVFDVAPIQVANCRRKINEYCQVIVRHADAACPGNATYDAVCCYFRLHEMPDDYKRAVVNAHLEWVAPGGKVIFIDYHKPHWAHPLKLITNFAFDTLEPFAKGLWRRVINEFARNPDQFSWHKKTYFGGLFQKVVARHQEEWRKWK